MALLQDKDREQLRETFANELRDEVTIVVFTQGESPLPAPATECGYCSETRQLMEEFADLSDKLRVEVHDFQGEPEVAARYNIDKIPAIALVGPDGVDHGIRFFGIPAGYEAGTIITDLALLSKGETQLSPATIEELQALERDVHLQVFLTPT